MFCSTCGAQCQDTAHFCSNCGAPLQPTQPSTPRRLLVYLPAFLAGAAVVAVVGLVLLGVFDGRAGPSALIGSLRESPTVTPTITLLPTASLPLLSDIPSPTKSPSPSVTPTATRTPLSTSTSRPTATPSPTPSPTPSDSPIPTDTPTSTRTPKPTCRTAKKGMIGFHRQRRCDAKTGNACGPVETWVMNADGSNQALMCNPAAYTWALVRDRTANDSQWRLDVSSQKADIIRVYTGGQWEWLIQNNKKDWDPVLSADNWWVAWVTNRNANDEIYIKTMDPQDQNQRRLTVNNWEWDKHPTWSPDGHKIAFYSNRADKLNEATRQIWVMDIVNDQGTNLRNLSNRPDRVDTDPVWFKWDNMP